jgi:DNA polymerase III delta subunit
MEDSMTIPGRSFDGWPLHPKYQSPAPLTRSPKCHELSIKAWEGRELAIVIRQSLADRGVVISDERYELIAEACEKEL